MEVIVKEFLKDKINTNISNEKLNYKFSIKSTKDFFDKEFSIFLGYYSAVFYLENRFVTSFNSYEIRLEQKVLIHFFNLYQYSLKESLKYESLILIEFLYSYYKTINTEEYKNNISNFREVRREFSEVLSNLKLGRKFHTIIVTEIFTFYEEIINFSLKTNKYSNRELIQRIFNNTKDKVDYNNLIEALLPHKKHIAVIIEYDNQMLKHKKFYLKYIHDSLESFGGYEYINYVLNKLITNNCVTEKEIKNIINKYIDIVNNLCEKTIEKQYSFIQGIAEFDHLISELRALIENVSLVSDKFKSKVREMIILLLSVKRYLTSDDEYVKSEMKEFEYKYTISTKEIEEFKKTLIENVTKLYQASKINFTEMVGTALENYSKHPLSHIGVSFQINSENGTYLKELGQIRNINNNFKEYFDKIGYEYTLNSSTLVNKLEKNYYEQLLKYSEMIFSSTQNLLRSFFTQEEFNLLLKKLRNKISCDYNNNYAIVNTNIIAIEFNIMKLLQKKGIEYFEDGYKNLNSLFIQYEDAKYKDGLMYINYILYLKSGLNLRNNMMHGNNLNQNLDIALLTTFAALIYISWLLNE